MKEQYRDVPTKEVHRNVRKGNGDRAIGGVYTKFMQENPLKTIEKRTCDCKTDKFESGVILDPFAGAGTTGLVADRLGKNAILIELNAEYVEIIKKRIYGDNPLFNDLEQDEHSKVD